MRETRKSTTLFCRLVACLPLWASVAAHGAEPEAFEHTGNQSALESAGPQAAGIEVLWWSMFWFFSAVFVGVMILLFWGIWQARRGEGRRLSDLAARNLVIAAGVALPLATAIVLVGGSLMLSRSMSAAPPDDALRVEVTGWRWWWEIRYLDENGDTIATTANELHIPADRPVALRLTSGDVIHSFWVPELHGKVDLVPGETNTAWFQADNPGRFRGQCAEFCGVQHSLMAFLVIAQPEQEFEAWLARQQQPAREPETARERRGRDVFLSSQCNACHTIRGVGPESPLGPDLTHFGSRRTLAAATRLNTPGHLGGWISDPQGIKPGNRMPSTDLTGEELNALIAYLHSLE